MDTKWIFINLDTKQPIFRITLLAVLISINHHNYEKGKL